MALSVLGKTPGGLGTFLLAMGGSWWPLEDPWWPWVAPGDPQRPLGGPQRPPPPPSPQWMVKSKAISELQEACWEMVAAMASDIILLLDSDNDGVRTHAIKFVEGLIITLSPRVADSDVPKRHENDISLERVPKDHPYIKYSEGGGAGGGMDRRMWGGVGGDVGGCRGGTWIQVGGCGDVWGDLGT